MNRLFRFGRVVGVLAVLTCALAGAQDNPQGVDLLAAAQNGDLPRVEALLHANADVNMRDAAEIRH